MNEFSVGFVALVARPITADDVRGFVSQWMENFERVEQVIPGQVATTRIQNPNEVMIREHMQFRILNGDQFAWVYATLQRRSIETTGMPNGDQPSLSLGILTELIGITQIIPDYEERKLDTLEAEGLL